MYLLKYVNDLYAKRVDLPLGESSSPQLNQLLQVYSQPWHDDIIIYRRIFLIQFFQILSGIILFLILNGDEEAPVFYFKDVPIDFLIRQCKFTASFFYLLKFFNFLLAEECKLLYFDNKLFLGRFLLFRVNNFINCATLTLVKEVFDKIATT